MKTSYMCVARSFGFSLLVLVGMAAESAVAVNITWIGGNVDWVNNGSTANWNPADEPDSNDTAIFNTANSVNLGSNNAVNGLTLSGGIDLFTNGFDLTVDGATTASGAGTNFFIDDNTSLVAANTVAINSGGTIQVRNGSLSIDEETGTGFLDINTGGTFSGFGEVNLNDGPGVITSLLINDGTLSAFRQAQIIIQPPPVGTLTINAPAANARINLDGGAEAGVVNVMRNQTLEINGTLADAFSGDLNMFHDTTLDISTNWSMDGGTFDVVNGLIDSPFPSPDVPAGTAAIAGGAFTQTGGTILNFSSDGTLVFDALFTQSGGTFTNNGLVVFNNNTLISNAANMTMPTNTSSITVGSGAVVNVDQPNFNVDGNGTATNIIRINGGGQLDLDLGVGADDTITGTVILGGGELDVTTSDNTWSLGGNVNTVLDSGTSQLNGETLSFDNADITVASGSTLDVNTTNVWNDGTTAVIDGLMTLDGAATFVAGANDIFITGDGTLRIGSTSTFSGIATTIDVSTFDWDGTTTGQTHTIADGSLLIINSPAFDSDNDMDDNISLAGTGALEVNGPAQWTMRGILTTAGGDINGTSRLVLLGSGADFNVNGNASVNAPITFGAESATTISATGVLDLLNFAEYSGATITGPGVLNPSFGANTVSGNTLIETASFDFDRGNWIVNSGSALTVNVGDYDTDEVVKRFDGIITIEGGGSVDINTGSAAFVMDGILNMGTQFQQALWTGEPLEIGDDLVGMEGPAELKIDGISQIAVPIDFNSDARVNISSAGHLTINQTAIFNSVNGSGNAEFTGDGTFVLNRQANFNEATTFNMPGGVVDFDGIDFAANTININAPVVVNAETFAAFGNANVVGGADTMNIVNTVASGKLTVNLDDPNGEWTLNPEGVLNLVNDNAFPGDDPPDTLLAGSDINIDGTVNVTGDVRVEARVDIGVTGVVNINSLGEALRLSGGDLNESNTIAGAIITGLGTLAADSNTALYGFGTITTRVSFAGSAVLRAANGMLTINFPASAGTLGTHGSDSILDITSPWNTNTTLLVDLDDGELRGGTITNDGAGGISGHGLVSARVINNTRIQASGGTLVVQTSANDNDWDGETGTGQLAASIGNLEVRDSGSFAFTGTVSASDGHEVFTNGFELRFEPGSTLNLASGGVFKSNEGVAIGGNVVVAGSANSRIETDDESSINFLSGSLTTLNGNLEISTDIAFARAGSSFTGPGSLIVLAGTEISLADTGVIDVLVNNSGKLSIGGAGVGRADLRDYIQSVTGSFDVDLRGLALDQFDRLVIDGAAQLAGTLELGLGGGFVPDIDDTFAIISASAGVSGEFASVLQPANMPEGLLFDVVYSPNLVQLKVIEAPIFSADFDLDGDVDSDDLDEWQAGYGIGTLQTQGDADGDGDVDGRDFLAWQRQFGSGVPAQVANIAVPEPDGLVFMALIAMVTANCRRSLSQYP